MYAIVSTGGKQYKVAKDDVIVVEKLTQGAGEKVEFDVLFVADGDKVITDPAALAKMKATGEVVEQFKGEKQIVFKFKKRKGYKKLNGHRQNLTRVRITALPGEKAAPKAAAKAPKAAAAKTEKPAVEKTEKPAASKAAKPAAAKPAAEKPATKKAEKPAAEKPAAKKAPAKKAAPAKAAAEEK